MWRHFRRAPEEFAIAMQWTCDLERRHHLFVLVEAYIENDLPDADRQALCEWLQADRAHKRRFIRGCFLHWQLFAIGRRMSLQNGVNDLPRQTGLVELSSVLGGNHPQLYGRSRARFGTRTLAAVAATLLVACGLGAWTLFRVLQPETVAQLTRATADAAWNDSSTAPSPGTFLHKGQLIQLKHGRVLTTLSSGVQVVMQGPATIRMDAGNMLFLQTGRITITVPRQASGFAVESPVARFVDLGTEFTLDMQPESGCELHVFSGLVEMQPNDAHHADRLRVPEGRAIEYDAASGAVDTLPYQASERMSL